jgi:hypothetical protein
MTVDGLPNNRVAGRVAPLPAPPHHLPPLRLWRDRPYMRVRVRRFLQSLRTEQHSFSATVIAARKLRQSASSLQDKRRTEANDEQGSPSAQLRCP